MHKWVYYHYNGFIYAAQAYDHIAVKRNGRESEPNFNKTNNHSINSKKTHFDALKVKHKI